MAGVMFNRNYKCPLDDKYHAIRQCTKFIVVPVEQKLRIVAQYALCYNCLAQSHTYVQCKSIDRCRQCTRKHNSWLHPVPEGKIWVRMTAHLRVAAKPGQKPIKTRALIDPWASRSSITLREAGELQCTITSGRTKLTIFHEQTQRYFNVELAVEDKSYGRSPLTNVRRDCCSDKIEGYANRHWNKSLPYYVILGSDVTSRILIGPAVGKPGGLLAQDTVFGLAYFGEAYVQDFN